MWQDILVTTALVGIVTSETTVGSVENVTGTGTDTPMTTKEPITEFCIILNHMESSTSSIKFMWEVKVPNWMKVTGYEITASQKGSEAVMRYPQLPGTKDLFEAEDLVKNAQYDVCVTSHVMNETESVEFTDCFDSFTIPYIRPDSVFVLLLVTGYILLMILIGYISWRGAVAKATKESSTAEAEEQEEEEGDTEGTKQDENLPEEHKPILLSSPSDDQPRSSIEDEDIPYITPPWSDMENEENEKQTATNSFSHI